MHSCPATSAPGLRSALPHLRRGSGPRHGRRYILDISPLHLAVLFADAYAVRASHRRPPARASPRMPTAQSVPAQAWRTSRIAHGSPRHRLAREGRAHAGGAAVRRGMGLDRAQVAYFLEHAKAVRTQEARVQFPLDGGEALTVVNASSLCLAMAALQARAAAL